MGRSCIFWLLVFTAFICFACQNDEESLQPADPWRHELVRQFGADENTKIYPWDVAVGSDGKLRIIYEIHQTNEGYRLFFASNETGEWETVLLKETFQYYEVSNLVLDSENKAHLLFVIESDDYYRNPKIVNANNQNGEWETEDININENWTIPKGKAIINLDSSDNPHIFAHFPGEPTSYDWYNYHLSKSNGEWIAQYVPQQTNDWMSYGPGSFAIDSTGRPHYIYIALFEFFDDWTNDDNIQLRYYNGEKETLLNQDIDYKYLDYSAPMIVFDNQNRPIISYLISYYGSSALHLMFFKNGQWNREVVESDLPEEFRNAVSTTNVYDFNWRFKMIVDQENRVHLWYNGRYKIRTDGHWETVLDGGWSNGMLALDTDGYAHILRVVDDSDTHKLYHSTNRP